MEVQFSGKGNASYSQILQAIEKRQSVKDGKLIAVSLATVATDLGLTVREVRQALQRLRKQSKDYQREKVGAVTLKDGRKLMWNAYSEPIEYAITPKAETPKAVKPTTPPKKGK